jgi:hypothetical protein
MTYRMDLWGRLRRSALLVDVGHVRALARLRADGFRVGAAAAHKVRTAGATRASVHPSPQEGESRVGCEALQLVSRRT